MLWSWLSMCGSHPMMSRSCYLLFLVANKLPIVIDKLSLLIVLKLSTSFEKFVLATMESNWFYLFWSYLPLLQNCLSSLWGFYCELLDCCCEVAYIYSDDAYWCRYLHTSLLQSCIPMPWSWCTTTTELPIAASKVFIVALKLLVLIQTCLPLYWNYLPLYQSFIPL
jgi:hypothetical protein